MRGYMRLVVSGALLLMLCAQARAQLPEPVRRYVDQSTVAIGRLDVSAFDAEAIVAYAAGMMGDVPAEQREAFLGEMRADLAKVEEGIAPLRERGVTTAWLIFGTESLMGGVPPLIVVPVENEEQAALVTGRLAEQDESHQRVEGAVLIGRKTSIEAAKAMQPADRPAFAANFADAGAAVQIVVEPTPTVRMALEQGLQQLAQAMPQVAPESAGLAQSLKTLKLSLALPPKPAAQVVLSFADAAAAAEAQGLLKQAVQNAQEAADARAAEAGGLPAGLTQQLAAAMEPQAQGSDVVVRIDEAELRGTLGGPLMAGLMQARDQAEIVRSASNMRMIGGGLRQALIADQEGRYPADLAGAKAMVAGTLAPDEREQGMRELFTSPRTGASDGYAYVRPVLREKDLKENQWRTLVVLYERPPASARPEYIVNVLFPDGHVEPKTLAELEAMAKEQGFEVERLPGK